MSFQKSKNKITWTWFFKNFKKDAVLPSKNEKMNFELENAHESSFYMDSFNYCENIDAIDIVETEASSDANESYTKDHISTDNSENSSDPDTISDSSNLNRFSSFNPLNEKSKTVADEELDAKIMKILEKYKSKTETKSNKNVINPVPKEEKKFKLQIRSLFFRNSLRNNRFGAKIKDKMYINSNANSIAESVVEISENDLLIGSEIDVLEEFSEENLQEISIEDDLFINIKKDLDAIYFKYIN